MKKLLLICLLFLIGNQLLTAQTDYISWEFRGGRLLRNPGGSTGPGDEPAGLNVAAIPDTPISRGRLRSAILADLDNDDDLDFISGSQGGTVHYFENTGAVTAPNWVAASIPTMDTIWIDRDRTDRNQNRPQLADIDDDGDLDLFIGTQYDYNGRTTDDIHFYKNAGTPETPVFEYVPASLPGLKDQDIAEVAGLGFVDLDNDTDLDLVALGGDKLTYYKNIGTKEAAVFELQSEADSPWDDENAYTNMDVPIPVFEDFDKDGDYDMFFMIDSGFVRWIENVGTATVPDFASSPQQIFNGELTNGEIGSFPTIDFGDVDGDGLKDAILASFNVPRFAWFRQVPVCIDPTIPTVTATPVLCEGETSTITISGTLNIASTWSIYTDSCGGTLVGTTTTNTATFEVTPTAPNTTYYIRGEDGDINCIDETTATCTMVTVMVNAIDDASFNYSAAIYCTNDPNPTPTITGLAGGVFSSTSGLSIDPASGIIDIAASTTGSYTVTYTTTGTCPNSSDVTVDIVELDDASFNYSAAIYCKDDPNPSPTITGLAGGVFSSTPGLSIDPASGIIDIAASTTGSYTVTYTTTGTCPNSSDVTVDIVELDDASFNYSAAIYCKDDPNPSPTITGLAGGVFSSTSGLSIDPASGIIDIAASTAGSYTVTYTTTGTCPNSSDVTVDIVELDDASFNYSAAIYCKDDSNPSPTVTGLAGGVFSSTTGLSIDPASGIIDIAASTAGSYTVTYTTAGTCPNSSDIAVDIIPLDDAGFSYDASEYCADASNPAPTITGLTGGTFSAAAGLSIDENTGNIDLQESTPGNYTITYTTAGSCSNSSTANVTINAFPETTVTDDSSTLTAIIIAGATYQWIDCDTDQSISGETGTSFTPTENGVYAVDITLNGCTNRSSCFNITLEEEDTIANFKIYPNPSNGIINVTIAVKKITIYNYYGRKVLETSNTTFDISTLRSGMYFMEVDTGKDRTIKKIVRR